MKITVGTSSQSLADILTAEQKNYIAMANKDSKNDVLILNLDLTNAIYIEYTIAATTTNGFQIPANGGSYSVNNIDLEKLNIVAGSEVTDVRVLVN